MEGGLHPGSAASRREPDAGRDKPNVPVNTLPQILDLIAAKPLRDSLLSKPVVILDASEVERMSTPCAQVLLAAGQAAGASFRIINPSAAFRSAIADLGLRQAFSGWMD
jgi:anti-anti-sigma regulatory factor